MCCEENRKEEEGTVARCRAESAESRIYPPPPPRRRVERSSCRCRRGQAAEEGKGGLKVIVADRSITHCDGSGSRMDTRYEQ